MIKKIDKSFLISLIILVLMIVIFQVTTDGRLLQKRNVLNLINQSLTVLIAGLGMIFVASMGGTDITTGVVAALAGMFAAVVASKSFLLAFPAAILIGALFGLFLGTVNAFFKVPSFMASLSILIAGKATITWITSKNMIFATPEIMALNKFEYKLPILLFLIVIMGYILEFTPFGNYLKAIGENETAVVYMGVNVRKIKMLAFMISGIMFGIAGIFVIARSGGVSNTTGTGMEMQVMMALFIGGIPVAGGTGSKIYKLLVGAPLIAILENGLVLSGSLGPLTQLVKGLILLLIVYLSISMNKIDSLKQTQKAKEELELA